jgi:hypothetical protein
VRKHMLQNGYWFMCGELSTMPPVEELTSLDSSDITASGCRDTYPGMCVSTGWLGMDTDTTIQKSYMPRHDSFFCTISMLCLGYCNI